MRIIKKVTLIRLFSELEMKCVVKIKGRLSILSVKAKPFSRYNPQQPPVQNVPSLSGYRPGDVNTNT